MPPTARLNCLPLHYSRPTKVGLLRRISFSKGEKITTLLESECLTCDFTTTLVGYEDKNTKLKAQPPVHVIFNDKKAKQEAALTASHHT